MGMSGEPIGEARGALADRFEQMFKNAPAPGAIPTGHYTVIRSFSLVSSALLTSPMN